MPTPSKIVFASLVAVSLASLVGCAGPDTSTVAVVGACTADAQCDAGDLCLESVCQGSALRRSDSLLVSPSHASRTVAAQVKPAAGWFTLYNLTFNNHGYAISCDDGATPSPAKGTLEWWSWKRISVDLQAPAAGKSKVTCAVTSPSGATSYGTFALTLSATGQGDGGTGGVATSTSDFSIDLSPAALRFDQGQSGQATVTIATTGTPGESVALSVSGLPDGADAAFSPAAVANASGTSLLTLRAGTAAAGDYTVTILASGSSARHAATLSLTLTVPPPVPDFALAAAPGSLALTAGGSAAAAQLTVTPIGGFARDVSLTVSGAPAGASARFDRSTIVGGDGAATLTVQAATSTQAGTWSLTIAGSGGSAQHSTQLTLAIAAATPPPPPPACTTDTWSNYAQGLFANKCAGCHGWAKTLAGVKTNQAGSQADFTDGSMPPAGPVPDTDKQRVLKWLACGLP